MATREQPASSIHEAPVEDGCAGCGAAVEGFRCGHCGVAKVVNGYRVLRLIAQGPHSRVYQARAPSGEPVALKELVFALVPDIVQLEAFEREAKILRTLDHPRIPKFLDSFQDGAGVHTRLYLAQQFVEGRPLSTMTAQPWRPEQVELLARDALEVLGHLHSRAPKVLHRDVKPANLILGEDGRVKLVDFGSALAHPRGATHGATLVGTFGYMPPEQLGGTVDETCDLYALGATLLHLLTGRPPTEFLNSATELEVPRELELPERLRIFLHGLTARRREDRYRTARMALRALDGLETLTLTGEHPVYPQRRRWRAAAAVGLALAVAGGGLALVRRARRPAAEAAARLGRSRPVKLAPVVSDAVVTRWSAHQAPISAVAFGPAIRVFDGGGVAATWLVTGGQDRSVKIWPAWGGEAISLRGAPPLGELPIEAVAAAQSGLVAAATSASVHLWEESERLNPRTGLPASFSERFAIRTGGGLAAIAFSPDQRTLITASTEGPAKEWDVATGKRLRDFPVPGGSSAVAFDPLGNFVVLGEAVNDASVRVRVFATGTGEPGYVFDGHRTRIQAVAVDRRGEIVASASEDSTWVWAVDGSWRRRLPVPEAAGRVSLAFSRPGDLLARADSANGLELFDPTSAERVAALVDDLAMTVNALSFTGFGDHLATVGNDRQVRIWRTPER